MYIVHFEEVFLIIDKGIKIGEKAKPFMRLVSMKGKSSMNMVLTANKRQKGVIRH